MRYAASEKLEIIQLIEQSSLPAKRTLEKLGIPEGDLLPVVRSLSDRRARSLERPLATAGSRLEPHS